jgi:hypothetical protein
MTSAVSIAAIAFTLAFCTPRAANADEAAAPASAASTYTLEVDSDSPDTLSYDVLAERLARELGAPVVRATEAGPARARIAVRYRAADRTVAVRATHAGGQVLERTVAAAGDPDAIQRDTVLLAGNLARDEARELIDQLAAKGHAPESVQPAQAKDAEPRDEPRDEPRELVTFGFLYPLASNFGRPNVVSEIDLSVLYGRVGRVDAVQASLGAAHATRGVDGVQAAAGVVINEGPTSGVQAAAGGALAFGPFSGYQTAVGFAFVRGNLEGGQVATGASIVWGNVHGVQAASAANVASGDVRGAQVSVGANVSRDVDGAQIGFVNVGRKVSGVQAGVVNVADEVDESIGLVSISRGSLHPIAWGGSLDYANVGIKFTSKHLYSTLAFSAGSLETDWSGIGATGALGVHVPVAGAFDLELEGVASELVDPKKRQQHFAVSPRLVAGYSFAPHLRPFVGGGARIPAIFESGREIVRPEVVAGVQF